MKLTPSVLWTVAGAVVGGIIFATGVPPLLDLVYHNTFASELKHATPSDDSLRADGSPNPDYLAGGSKAPVQSQAKQVVTPTPNANPPEGGQAGKPSGTEVAGAPGSSPSQAANPGTEQKPKEQPRKIPSAHPAATSEPVAPPTSFEQGHSIVGTFLFALVGMLVGGAVGSYAGRLSDIGVRKWEAMPKGDRVTIFLGCIVGLIVSMSLIPVVQALAGPYLPLVLIPLIVLLSGTAIYMLQSMEEALPWYTQTSARKRSGIKIFDTNVLIDGRIYEIIRCGFIEGQFYVPQFVILELQHIADSSDSLRRQRGRRGLDVLKKIQSEFNVEVGTHDRFASDPKEEVDSRLVKIAKAMGGSLVSNDFNLNKVATIQEVPVLNINDLAISLRPTVVPGEKLEIVIQKEGSQARQGVGYLDDGTMVVVEHASEFIGQPVLCEVTQVHQTERGKMIFADTGIGADEPEVRRPSRFRS